MPIQYKPSFYIPTLTKRWTCHLGDGYARNSLCASLLKPMGAGRILHHDHQFNQGIHLLSYRGLVYRIDISIAIIRLRNSHKILEYQGVSIAYPAAIPCDASLGLYRYRIRRTDESSHRWTIEYPYRQIVQYSDC